MISARHARKIRAEMERHAMTLDDAQALEVPEMFPLWDSDRGYFANDRVRYGGTLYKCLQAHTSTNEWNPENAVSLWAEVLIPDPDIIPEWRQPDSTNPYMIGDLVTYDGKTWRCTIDYNVFAPGVAGWEVVE